MRIEIRSDSVLIEGYVNAVARDSRPMRDKKTGKRFVEQIVPGAFKRAIDRREVNILLNHDTSRILGSTKTNLSLWEDSIGLRACVEIQDAEVIQKAKEKKLRGWSFGFLEIDASEEDLPSGISRRYVEALDLMEVSIIDERKIPCYEGTSIETRAEGEVVLTPEPLEVRACYVDAEPEKPHTDLSNYKSRIKKLEKENQK